MATPHRFLIRRHWLVRPLLLLIGWATDSRSYLAIEDGRLRVCFGWLFDHSFDLDSIASVEASRWPLIGRLGWRANFAGKVGLVGSYSGIVEIHLRQKVRVRGIIPFVRVSCDQLFVSLEEPVDFVAVLRRELAAEG